MYLNTGMLFLVASVCIKRRPEGSVEMSTPFRRLSTHRSCAMHGWRVSLDQPRQDESRITQQKLPKDAGIFVCKCIQHTHLKYPRYASAMT